jgi:ABC-2 type transport system permease protein
VTPTVRPFTYDFRRTLTSATVVAVIIITVVLSGAFVPFLRAAAPGSSITPSNIGGVAYYDNSTGVNVLAYSFNQFGQPISGTAINVTATSGTTAQSASQLTNGSGYAHVTIDLPYPAFGAGNFLSVTAGGIGNQLQIPQASGFPTDLFSVVSPVIDQSNSSKIDVGVFASGLLGTPPKNYGVYFAINPTSGPGNASGMTPLGHMSSYFQVFSFPPGTKISPNDSILFSVFDPSGAEVLGYGMGGASFQTSAVYQQYFVVQNLASGFVAGLLGLFVPLMAVLASYSTYGKDRVSGVLESVLARPVSRKGLSISRFTSTSLAMVVAVVLATIALDVVCYFAAGFLLSWSFLGTVIGALSVEAVAFVGLLFALSRVIKSGGALVGVGVGLWAILELFWSLIIYLVAVLLHLDLGSATYYRLTVDSGFFNPAQFYSLVSTLSSSSFSGISFSPADYGITPYTLVAAGILWVVLPFALFLYLAVKKD